MPFHPQRFIFALLFSVSATIVSAQALIPVPAHINPSKGEYRFRPIEKIIITDTSLQNEATELKKIIQKRTGSNTHILYEKEAGKRNISLRLDTSILQPEGYRIAITPQRIAISAATPTGVFRALQTLDQLLSGDGGQSLHPQLPAIEIEDAPRYGYRALMLDPARHFIPLPEIKRFIDLMARYKFNILQLHLTDDQGWRIEIRKYPQLTSTGAFRAQNSGNQGPHNGFYTQQELQELINYAARKHIEIIPELDIPGHTVATILAYPGLGCKNKDSIPIIPGKTTDRTLCAAKEEVYTFYANVLQEVCSLFPSPRIHLGGDEAIIEENWGQCPDCQNLMHSKGFQNVREIMGYFFSRIHETVRKHQKQLLLWCELDNIRMPAEEFLFPYPKDCTLFTWRMGLTPKVIELTGKAGINLIASPGEHCYFDYPQYKGDLPEYNNWGMPLLPLQQAYNWDPGYYLPAGHQKHIIGVAGLLWGEALQDMNRITYMAYPRALALAEAGWSLPENRNWESFKKRLVPQLFDLIREGVSFRVPFEIINSKELTSTPEPSNSEKHKK